MVETIDKILKHDIPLGKGSIRMFVYGTLKSGQCNYPILRECGAQKIGRDSITGLYDLVDMSYYPALMHGSTPFPDNTVYGEVWMGDINMLNAIDFLEGHPNFYKREKVWTDRLHLKVWVYFLDSDWSKEAADVIETGMWEPKPAELAYWKLISNKEKRRAAAKAE